MEAGIGWFEQVMIIMTMINFKFRMGVQIIREICKLSLKRLHGLKG